MIQRVNLSPHRDFDLRQYCLSSCYPEGQKFILVLAAGQVCNIRAKIATLMETTSFLSPKFPFFKSNNRLMINPYWI